MQPLDAAKSYKVAVPSFLATGGDNFRAFTEGTTVDTGLLDYEAWIDYLRTNAPVSPDFARRAVQAEGLKGSYGVGDTVTFSLPKLDLTSLGSPKNTTVKVTLLNGGNETDLGDFPVSAGAASPSVQLPAGVSGSARLRVDVAPSGTSALLPPFEITKPASTVQAATLPLIPQGSWTVVAVKVDGAAGTPTGKVTVSEGDKVLGTAKLWRGAALILTDARSLAPGKHQLTVTYAGDAANGAGTDVVAVTVLKKRGH